MANNILTYKGKMKEDMEREAGKTLNFMEDALVSLLEECLTVKEVYPSEKGSAIVKEVTPLQDNNIITEKKYMNEDILRIEALKLAYQFDGRYGKLSLYPDESELEEHLNQIFELADKNFNYLKQGIT